MFLFFISSSSIVMRRIPLIIITTSDDVVGNWFHHYLWMASIVVRQRFVNERKWNIYVHFFLISFQWILSWPRRATRNDAVWWTPTHDAMYARRTKHNRTRPDEVCQGRNCMQLLFVVCAFEVWPHVLAVWWAGNSELIHLCVLWRGVEIGSSCRRRLCCDKIRSAVPHMPTARIWLPPAIQRHISRQFIYRRWKQRKRERAMANRTIHKHDHMAYDWYRFVRANRFTSA